MPMPHSHLLVSLVMKTVPQQSNLSCRKFGPTLKLRKLSVHPPILTVSNSPTIRCVSAHSLASSSKHGNNSQAVSTKVKLELEPTISDLSSSQLYFLLWNNVLPKLGHQEQLPYQCRDKYCQCFHDSSWHLGRRTLWSPQPPPFRCCWHVYLRVHCCYCWCNYIGG